MEVSNPGAEPLRALLTRYGTAPAAPVAGAAPPGTAPQAYAPPSGGYAPPAYPAETGPSGAPMQYGQAAGSAPPVQLAPTAPVQQQNLPAPGR